MISLRIFGPIENLAFCGDKTLQVNQRDLIVEKIHSPLEISAPRKHSLNDLLGKMKRGNSELLTCSLNVEEFESKIKTFE